MVSQTRAQRIADRIRQDLAEVLLQHVSDPRLTGVNVTDVTVDRELAYAEVYVSALEGAQRAADVIEGLKHAQGYLRRALAQQIDLRTFPKLRFHWDPTFERAEHIEKILASLKRENIARPDDKAEQDG
jgi:ribosome-binding factor A